AQARKPDGDEILIVTGSLSKSTSSNLCTVVQRPASRYPLAARSAFSSTKISRPNASCDFATPLHPLVDVCMPSRAVSALMSINQEGALTMKRSIGNIGLEGWLMSPDPSSACALHAVRGTAPRHERSWREQRGGWRAGSAIGARSGWVSAAVVAAALGVTPALADNSCNSGNVPHPNPNGKLLSSPHSPAAPAGPNATTGG